MLVSNFYVYFEANGEIRCDSYIKIFGNLQRILIVVRRFLLFFFLSCLIYRYCDNFTK